MWRHTSKTGAIAQLGWLVVALSACGAAPTGRHPGSTASPSGGRCGAELPPSPFTKPGSTRVVVADFYGLGPDDAPLVLKVAEQVDDVLRRFREETVPGMKVEVSLDDIEFGRLPCFVKSHEEAERVAAAWEADLVLWGKAYCTQEDRGKPQVVVDQHIEVQGDVKAAGQARVNIGQVEVAVPSTEVICPSATLHSRDIGLRRTDELPGLQKMELPVLSTSKPGSLLAFTLGLHFAKRNEPWKAARFYELAAGDVLAEGGGRGMDVLHLYLGYAYFHIEGGLEKSLTHSRAALRFHEGRGTREEARLLNNIGGALGAQGNTAEGEGFFRRALAIDEKALGPDHPSTATCLNNIGGALQDQGKAAEAEDFYRRALAIDEKALGPDHPSTAVSLNNIGGALQDQGKAAEAEDFYRRALVINEKALGPDHPDTATCLNNIGVALQAQGKAAEAEGFHRRALAIAENGLGPDHPDTATNLSNIGFALAAQGKAAEAEGFYRRALAIDEKALGPDHPSTARDLNSIGSALQAQGKAAEAEGFYRRALAINEKALGSDHPSTAIDLNNIGSALQDQGKLVEAEAFYLRAHEVALAPLGPEHPNTQVVLDNLLSVRATLAGRKGDEGALVVSTQPGGQAEAIGLQPGDLIRRYGKTKLRNMKHLVELTGQPSPGASIELEVVRGKRVLRLSVRGGRLGAVVR